MSLSRRDFFKRIGLAIGVAIVVPEVIAEAVEVTSPVAAIPDLAFRDTPFMSYLCSTIKRKNLQDPVVASQFLQGEEGIYRVESAVRGSDVAAHAKFGRNLED